MVNRDFYDQCFEVNLPKERLQYYKEREYYYHGGYITFKFGDSVMTTRYNELNKAELERMGYVQGEASVGVYKIDYDDILSQAAEQLNRMLRSYEGHKLSRPYIGECIRRICESPKFQYALAFYYDSTFGNSMPPRCMTIYRQGNYSDAINYLKSQSPYFDSQKCLDFINDKKNIYLKNNIIELIYQHVLNRSKARDKNIEKEFGDQLTDKINPELTNYRDKLEGGHAIEYTAMEVGGVEARNMLTVEDRLAKLIGNGYIKKEQITREKVKDELAKVKMKEKIGFSALEELKYECSKEEFANYFVAYTNLCANNVPVDEITPERIKKEAEMLAKKATTLSGNLSERTIQIINDPKVQNAIIYNFQFGTIQELIARSGEEYHEPSIVCDELRPLIELLQIPMTPEERQMLNQFESFYGVSQEGHKRK